MRTLERKNKTMKTKKISVSEKRQITIPKDFFDALNIGKEIECGMVDNYIIIKPVQENFTDEFSEYILQDILKEGYKDKDILEEFKKRRNDLKKAAEEFNNDIDDEIKNISNLKGINEVFGSDE